MKSEFFMGYLLGRHLVVLPISDESMSYNAELYKHIAEELVSVLHSHT